MAATARVNVLGQATLLASGVPAILGLYALGPILPTIARAFHGVHNAELLSQLVGGLVGLAFAMASPGAAGLVRRFGYRVVYFWSTLVFSLAGLAVLGLDNLYLVLLTRAVLGAALAGVLVAAVTGMSTLPEAQRTKLFGLQTMVGGALGLVCYFVVAKLADAGWRTPFALHALGLLLLPFILMLPNTQASTAAGGHQAHASPAGIMPARGGPTALGGITASVVAVALFTGMAGLIGPMFGPFYLNTIGVMDPKMIALPLMVAAAAAVIAAYFYSRAQARVGVNGVFAGLLLMVGIGAGLSGLTSTLWQFTLAQVIFSAGLGWTLANLNATAVLVAPPALTARAIAVVNGVYYGAQALLPFVAGGLRKLAGPSAVFEGFALVGVAAGLAYLYVTINERRHPRVAPVTVEHAIEDAVS